MKGKKLTALFTCTFLLTTYTLSYAWTDSDSSGKAGEQGTEASGYIESDLDHDTPLYDSGIAMYYDRESAWGVYGDDSYNYYDTNRAGSGHAIMIVGWDDNFSKDNFKYGNKPAHDGAWLVRNSWGDYKDYFWMSYDTVSLLDTAWAFDFTGTDNYDNNYQLDGGIGTFKVSNYTRL